MSSALKIYALFIGSALLMFGGGLQGLLLTCAAPRSVSRCWRWV